jgi:hypothetical protein
MTLGVIGDVNQQAANGCGQGLRSNGSRLIEAIRVDSANSHRSTL